MLPLMNFYTEQEYKDLLDTFMRLIRVSTRTPIRSSIALNQEHWEAIWKGDFNMEYTNGIVLLNIPDVDGYIPVKIELSDIVKWIIGVEAGRSVKLPVVIFNAIHELPYSLRSGTQYTLLNATGDALIECLNINQHFAGVRHGA